MQDYSNIHEFKVQQILGLNRFNAKITFYYVNKIEKNENIIKISQEFRDSDKPTVHILFTM